MVREISCLLFALTLSVTASAWGPTGHRVTGLIAEKHLTRKARAAVNKILNGQSLAIASTWMDEIRSDSAYDFMTDWHWVTIPPGKTYQESEKNPNGDILQALEKVIAALTSGRLTAQEEVDNLRILIHLVGDIHQPLHVGDRDDRGGNDVRVTWFGQPGNLHQIWDSDIIDHTKLSYTELAQSLDKPGTAQVRAWQQSTIYDWAAESQSYFPKVYSYEDDRLGYEYAYKNYPVVCQRLLQAGVRLAGILNEIYR